MMAEELETVEFDWRFDNTSQPINLINLYETFPCLYDVRPKDHKNRDMKDKALVTTPPQVFINEDTLL